MKLGTPRTWVLAGVAAILLVALLWVYGPSWATEPSLPINAPANFPAATPGNVTALAVNLQHSDSKYAIAAAVSLGQTGSSQAAAPLLSAALHDSRPPVQAAALEGLTALRPQIDPASIIQLAASAPDTSVRAAALEYLAAQKVEAAAPVMVKGLEDPDVLVRGRAYAGIRRLFERDYQFHADDPPARRAAVIAVIRADNPFQKKD